jgi:hypothetical protein
MMTVYSFYWGNNQDFTGCRKAENKPIEPDLANTSEGKEQQDVR